MKNPFLIAVLLLGAALITGRALNELHDRSAVGRLAELERVQVVLVDCPNRPGVSADIHGPPTEETITYCLGGLSQ